MRKIGLIGAGYMGYRYLDAYAIDPNAEIVAVCEPRDERRVEACARYDVSHGVASYDELLAIDEVDTVIVATPDFAHRDPAIAALRAGRDVLCEKPLANTTEDAAAIATAVTETGRTLMVNFGNRQRISTRRLQDLLAHEEIGDVRYAFATLSERRAKTDTLPWADQTSPLWFLLSHVTDLVRWIIGAEIATVSAVDARVGGPDSPGTTAVLASFRNGAAATMESTWDLPDNAPIDVDLRLTLHGSRGVLTLDIGDQGLRVSDDSRSRAVQWDTDARSPASPEDWWVASCHYFTRCLVNGDHPTPDERDGLAVVQALSAMQRSLELGHSVPVES